MKKWNIAAYLRLSSDDGDKSESNSISNQRNIIKQYIKNNNLNVNANYYIDDGYSGTTFERPDFKKMLKDIKDNKINCIIVKDLSRLGRNYIEVGKYIDEIFPSYNIRFIAINDNVDTYNDSKSSNNIIVPFKNLMNDEYARDISNKVRSVLDNKKNNGQFIGSVAPFGYKKDPNNKHKFIIDKKAARIVKKVFAMILDGKSKKDVIDELNKMQILPPALYKIDEGLYNYDIKETAKKWDTKKIDKILKNQSYTGDLVQGKRKRISHKVHKNLDVPEENWIIIPNHHQALISKKDFDKVQELLYARNIRVKKNNEYDIFAGHLRCDNCGNSLVLRKSKKYEYYYCKSYLYNKECSKHACQKQQLEQDIVDIINHYKEIIVEMDSKINEILNKKEISYDLEIIKNKIQNAEEKKEKYIMLRNSIKEDLKENFISEEEYWQYNKEYGDKSKKIKEDIQLYEEEKETETIKNNDTDWMNIFKKKEKINELNRLLIDELIEDIVVSEDGNIKVIFKYEDKYFEALDFINKQKYDIILSS